MPLLGHRPRTIPARLSPRAFWRRFGALEHERLEFKRSPLRLQESIAAMAMTEGGVILVGVSDDRRLLGCAAGQGVRDRVAQLAHELDVELDVRPLAVGGTPLTAIVVPAVRGRVVTTADGRLLRRRGSSNQPVRGDAVARLVRERLGQ